MKMNITHNFLAASRSCFSCSRPVSTPALRWLPWLRCCGRTPRAFYAPFAGWVCQITRPRCQWGWGGKGGLREASGKVKGWIFVELTWLKPRNMGMKQQRCGVGEGNGLWSFTTTESWDALGKKLMEEHGKFSTYRWCSSLYLTFV